MTRRRTVLALVVTGCLLGWPMAASGLVPAGAVAAPSATSGSAHGWDEDVPEVRAAADALRAAERSLAQAQAAAAQADTEHLAARTADARAEAELRESAVRQQQIQLGVAAVERELAAKRDVVGSFANRSYRMGGNGNWLVLVGNGTTDDFLERLAYFDVLVGGGNRAIRELRQAQDSFRGRQRELERLVRRQGELRRQTAANLVRKRTAQQSAAAATAQIARSVTDRQTALASVATARALDLARNQHQQLASGQLGRQIITLQRRLQRSGAPPRGSGSFARPGAGAVTSPFGMRFHPVLHVRKVHTGTDLGRADYAVRAADDGVVLLTVWNKAYGWMTVVDHGLVGGRLVSTLYAHQSAFGVRPGDRVGRGQRIGTIGSTGYSTGPHLHFEVRVNGAPTDPGAWVPGLRG